MNFSNMIIVMLPTFQRVFIWWCCYGLFQFLLTTSTTDSGTKKTKGRPNSKSCDRKRNYQSSLTTCKDSTSFCQKLYATVNIASNESKIMIMHITQFSRQLMTWEISACYSLVTRLTTQYYVKTKHKMANSHCCSIIYLFYLLPANATFLLTKKRKDENKVFCFSRLYPPFLHIHKR